MPSNFSLASIVPEHDTFTDTDGSEHNVRAMREFSAIELTEFARLERKVRKAQKRVEESGDIEDDDESDKVLLKGQKLLSEAINGIIHILIPSLSMERVEVIEFAHKFHFMEWWKQQQPQAAEPSPNEKIELSIQASSLLASPVSTN